MNRFHRIMIRIAIILLAVCSAESCAAPPAFQPELDYWPTNDWQSTTPEAQGMDSALLVKMFETIKQDDIHLHSLLIERNGYLVVEAYWDPYGAADRHSIESNTKSIVGALVGIAIDQGFLDNVDQKMVDFFPERTIQHLDDQKKSITIHNLLSMTPGLTCQDQSSAGQNMFKAEDRIGYLLDLPVSDPPGTRWIYCSGAVHLLSAILQAKTGMDARAYANSYLFEPIGIPEVPVKDWNSDPQGFTNGIAGLYLTPRELAKFGYLYLNKGRWEDRQVVPASWVEASTHEQAFIGKDDYVGGLDRRFGYLWSIFPELNYYGYLGMAGQELYVVPEQNLVVVFTGSLVVGKEAELLKLVNDHIIPAALSSSALPANASAVSELEAVIQTLAGSRQPVSALPQIAFDITGKTYRLTPNALGWKDMTFFFQEGSEEAILRMAGSPDMKIGLDNRYRLTETPASRPVGLRGRWSTSYQFDLEYINQGDFIESSAGIEFKADRLTLTIKNRNFGGPPLVLHGNGGN